MSADQFVAGLDAVGAAAFAAAALLELRRGVSGARRLTGRLLATAFGIYALVGLTNVLEHAGLSARADVFGDYLAVLFLPLLAMYGFAAVGAAEYRRREASEERYRTLVEGMDLGVSLVGADHRVIMVNSAMGRLLGRDPASFAGALCHREFEGRDAVCPHCPGTLTMADGRPHEVESTGRRADGSAFDARVRTFPTFDKEHAVNGFLEIVEDITAERRAAAEHRRLEEQVRQTQKLESLGVLAGGIAHDFNNILAGIMGNAELALHAGAEGTRAGGHMAQVRALAERGGQLVNQLLAYAGRGSFEIRQLDLNAAVTEMLELLCLSISKKATLETEFAADLPAVPADAAQVRQVLMNLILNASEAIGEGTGRILVRTEALQADRAWLDARFPGWDLAPGCYVALEVSDSGAGMGAEVQARLFDPFFTTKATGRGLGLSAVLGIVKGHRGAINVASEPGRGTRFTVLLPAPAGGAARPAAGPPAAEVGLDAGRTVLVADDERQVREVTAQLLESLGCRVLTAADGAECVELFAARRDDVDLVLLDLTMPRLDGLEALRELRRLRPGVRVLMMSGYAAQETAARLGGLPVDGVLQKPFTVARLREALRGLPPL